MNWCHGRLLTRPARVARPNDINIKNIARSPKAPRQTKPRKGNTRRSPFTGLCLDPNSYPYPAVSSRLAPRGQSWRRKTSDGARVQHISGKPLNLGHRSSPARRPVDTWSRVQHCAPAAGGTTPPSWLGLNLSTRYSLVILGNILRKSSPHYICANA